MSMGEAGIHFDQYFDYVDPREPTEARCYKCQGSGEYRCGFRPGVCFACKGKGWLTRKGKSAKTTTPTEER